MAVGTPDLATHLVEPGRVTVTRVGAVLRRTSLDELPQLWNILRGHMSLVGPRPALYNQYDLIALRREAGVDALRPGLTGWAQVNGRDEISMERKVAYDLEYLRRRLPGVRPGDPRANGPHALPHAGREVSVGSRPVPASSLRAGTLAKALVLLVLARAHLR